MHKGKIVGHRSGVALQKAPFHGEASAYALRPRFTLAVLTSVVLAALVLTAKGAGWHRWHVRLPASPTPQRSKLKRPINIRELFEWSL